jgi:hypothetical protein
MKTQKTTNGWSGGVGWERKTQKTVRHARFSNPRSCLPGLGATDPVGLVRPLGQFSHIS